MFKMGKNNRGFTIIELLIVIVVIGILALLVLNTFNGVQERARNTQRVTIARSFIQAVSLYIVDNNDYPTPAGTVCAGTGYEDRSGSPLGDCRVNSSGVATSENVAIMANLQPYLGSTDVNGGTDPVFWNGVGYYGPMIQRSPSHQTDGEQAYIIFYMLEGYLEDCGLTALDGTWGNFTANNTNAGNFYAARLVDDATFCVVSLPQPSV